MEGSRKGSNTAKRKRRRRKRIGSIFLLLILLAAGTAGWLYFKYDQAVKNSEEEAGMDKEDFDFNGVKDPNGNINILLLGADAREGEKVSRTDTIMVAQYNPDTKKSKLVSIMRDSYVDIPGHNKNKINAAFTFGGTELLRQTIKENFDVDLQYYAVIDFKGFTKMIDTAFPDGIEIDVEEAMSKNIDVSLQPGLQKLHGKELLGYVRYRHDAKGDFGRVARQQKVLGKIADEVGSVQGILKLPTMIGTIQPYISTNLSKTAILSIGKSFLSSENRNIDTFRIPQDGTYQNRRYAGSGLVLDLDIEKNKAALKEFLNK